MQTRSSGRAVATPRRPQSVAALLPEEILDLVFAQFGFDYSTDMLWEGRAERDKNLSNMSVIADGWTKPARRLLVRSVEVRSSSWTHLQETVPGWAGKQVRELTLDGRYWGRQASGGPASAVFKLLKQLPNLRRLRLDNPRFDSFDPVDSASMQHRVLLPQLDDLFISLIPNPHSIIFDLLATSNHKISRLSVSSSHDSATPRVTVQKLDFRGNLRFLRTGPELYRTLVDSRWIAHDGLVGLSELTLEGIDERSREGGEELYRVIAPSLSTLSIESDNVAWFARFLLPFSRLSRLSISKSYGAAKPDPTPLLLCLPASLSFLQLGTDHQLGPNLSRWTAAPALVPAGLKRIQIDDIYQFETYRQLPPVPTLSTDYRSDTLKSLQVLDPSTLPFKTLEMWFENEDLDRRSLVEAECARLGVVFRQRLDYWDA